MSFNVFSPKLSKNAITILNKRYFKRDETGKIIEDGKDMFLRVAEDISSAEEKYGGIEAKEKYKEIFYEMMANLDFLPNSPTLMNAGKNLQQLSACFVLPVEDSMEGIFEAVKQTALIHKSGGGCIIQGSKVFTNRYGLGNIETLWTEFKTRKIHKKENGEYINIEKENIYTFSFNPKTGEFKKDKITHIWKFNLKDKKTYNIETKNGIKTITSSWHPFFVFQNGEIVQKRAEEIKTGDFLILPNLSIKEKWFFKKQRKIEGIMIDKEIGWLMGYFAGNGSLGMLRNKLRLRFSDGEITLIEKVKEILNKRFKTRVNFVYKDKRSISNYTIATINQSAVLKFQKIAEARYGKKSSTVRIPTVIMKSPLEVVLSFIVGCLDSDGYVCKTRPRLTFDTASINFAEEISCILNLAGIKTNVRVRIPKKRKWKKIYEVKIDGYIDLKLFYEIAGNYIKDNKKIDRIKNNIKKEPRNSGYYIPIDFKDFEPVLKKINIKTSGTEIWRKPVKIGGEKFWIHRWKQGFGIGKYKFKRLLIAILRENPDKDIKKLVKKYILITEHITQVKTIKKQKKEIGNFYDFTVKKNNNYLSGKFGLTVIHNTGFSFSNLRGSGSIVSTTKGIASGPVSFMKVFDSATETVKQGGARRGANMAILRVDHPDITDFIDCKKDQKELNNFNISVAITDEFMNALIEDKDYALIDPKTKKQVNHISAKKIFNMIVDNAHKNGEPGILFIDRINEYNSTPEIGLMESTNPCGEMPLLPYESCNLGSINLSNFVTESKKIDYKRLKDTVNNSVRFLDNVIDRNNYPLKQIETNTLGNRKIGLGVMGFADMLLKMDIPYNSEHGVKIGGKVMKFITEQAHKYSEILGKERGNFPNKSKSIYKDIPFKRNATVTTIAPTGTISLIAGTSSGIEPIFALSYYRNVLDGKKLSETHYLLKQKLEQLGLHKDELIREITEKGTLKNIKDISDEMKRLFVTSHDIKPEWHVKMQAEFQKYTDNAVSKTVNLPNAATKDDVEKVYSLAYRTGCKGVTVYRDGSRDEQVLMKNKTEQKTDVKGPRKRPNITQGKTIRIKTGCGKLYVTINEDEFGVCELLSTMGKAGGCTASQCEAVSRLISVCLRSNIEMNTIIQHLKGISCPNSTWDNGQQILSCADAIAKSLEIYQNKKISNGLTGKQEQILKNNNITSGGCPSCGGVLIYAEGCVMCRVCGYSKCG